LTLNDDVTNPGYIDNDDDGVVVVDVVVVDAGRGKPGGPTCLQTPGDL